MVITYRIIFYKLSFLSQMMTFVIFVVGAQGILKNLSIASTQTKYLLYLLSIFSVILLSYGLLYRGNEPSLAMRFFLITILLILSFFYPVNKKIVYAFLSVIFLHAIFIICFELFMVLNFEATNYGVVRFYIQEIGIGDIYTFDGKYWRIQLAGNHSLPLALFVTVILFRGKKRAYLGVIFLISSILSGQFAFLIGITFFILNYYLISLRLTYSNIVKLQLATFILVAIFYVPVSDYVFMILEKKVESSLVVRGDQATVLFDDMSNELSTFFLGTGFGHTVDVVSIYRDYSSKIYYELQTLYMINQWGFLYTVFFILTNLYLVHLKFKSKYVVLVYLSYLLYGFTNPYIFDSSHVITIIVLMSLQANLANSEVPKSRSIRHSPVFIQ
jgi:hypothetical protein